MLQRLLYNFTHCRIALYRLNGLEIGTNRLSRGNKYSVSFFSRLRHRYVIYYVSDINMSRSSNSERNILVAFLKAGTIIPIRLERVSIEFPINIRRVHVRLIYT